MSDEPDVIKPGDVGQVAKAATVLVERISDAIGGLCAPWHMKRIAKAEVAAALIKAQGQIDVMDLQRRAIVRFVSEEALKQVNMEQVTAKAIPLLEESSDPAKVEDDWIVNFFDKCRIISDEEMQSLWARVLAGEANSPGTFSRRTVNLIGSLDKSDAHLFTTLCGFCWRVGTLRPLIYDHLEPIYNFHGINFVTLSHLDDIGLVNFDPVGTFARMQLSKTFEVDYYGRPLIIEFAKETENHLNTGKGLLTQIGLQLAPICGSKPVDGFQDYIIKKWIEENLIVSSPLPVA